MSLINDALLKAERDRTDAAIADAARLPPLARAEKIREQKRRRSLAPVFINAALLAGIFAVLIVLVLRPRTGSPIAADAPTPRVADSQPAFPEPEFTASATPAESPFASVVDDTPPPPSRSADYALAGMTVLGAETLISVLHRSDQRSVWIPVGKSVNGISAVSYDAEKDLAVIRVGDDMLTIRMNASQAVAQPAE
jgi:hypothetical protein